MKDQGNITKLRIKTRLKKVNIVFRKLQLARFQWYLFLDEATYEADLETLVEQMNESLAQDATAQLEPHTVPNSPSGKHLYCQFI